MAWAQFEEKEFEVAAGIELSQGRAGSVWSSGQVLEASLGYDAAASPDSNHPIWRVLKVQRPRGVKLVEAHWTPGVLPAGGALPPTPVTLVLQYKRPEFLKGPQAKQWDLWRQPYLRFTREPRQQAVLSRLEGNLGSAAIVRYASPSFWTRGEYETAVLRGTVLQETGFVSPSRLKGHHVWTYVAGGTVGRPNPRGRITEIDMLGRLLPERARQTRPYEAGALWLSDANRSHLVETARATAMREPGLRAPLELWAERLRHEVEDLTSAQFEAVVAVATTTTILGAYRAHWYIV